MTSEQVVVQTQVGPLSRTDLVRYAGAGGDFNPLHHDEDFARNAGFPSVIAHGLLTAGITGAALSQAVGPLKLKRYAVRYTGQVVPGDTLSITATELEGTETRRIFSLEVTAAHGDGDARKVLSAEAEAER